MAAVDPVAEKSAFLKMYMSSHPDTLVAYAMHFGKVTDISTAEMSAIDTKSMTLTYKTKSGKDTKVVVVPILPPLKGYEDVKPRLLEMKAQAQEALGMIKAPRLETFEFPWGKKIIYGIAAAMGFMAYCTAAYSPTHSILPFNLLSHPPQSPIFPWGLGHLVVGLVGGVRTLQASWAFLVFCHVSEALFMARLSRKNTNTKTWLSYTFGTLVFGMPIIVVYSRRLSAIRINSVMKVQ